MNCDAIFLPLLTRGMHAPSADPRKRPEKIGSRAGSVFGLSILVIICRLYITFPAKINVLGAQFVAPAAICRPTSPCGEFAARRKRAN